VKFVFFIFQVFINQFIELVHRYNLLSVPDRDSKDEMLFRQASYLTNPLCLQLVDHPFLEKVSSVL